VKTLGFFGFCLVFCGLAGLGCKNFGFFGFACLLLYYVSFVCALSPSCAVSFLSCVRVVSLLDNLLVRVGFCVLVISGAVFYCFWSFFPCCFCVSPSKKVGLSGGGDHIYIL
jgi:hypothetical protein